VILRHSNLVDLFYISRMSTVFAEKCRKVVCIGRNYYDHVLELNNARPSQPFFFLKPPSSMLLPGKGPILAPKGVNLHYEVELALVMGKTMRDFEYKNKAPAAALKEAIDHIAGILYVVEEDIIAY
jgi:acylpyruvate hydrolase